VSRREYPRLPTGVGFCLYVKRSVLDEVGLFDEVFGLGYGEEVDLCLRAASRGYVHVLDDSTFVFHEGGRSFGTSRERRMRRGERLVLSRYPNYLRNVAAFIKKDPIAPARARVLDELRRSPMFDEPQRSGSEGAGALSKEIAVKGPLPRVLHLVPGWPPWASGDAATAVRRLVRDQSARREVFVYARMTDPDRADGSALEYLDGGVRVRLIVAGGTTQRTMLSRLSRIGVRPDPVGEDFVRFLDEVRPQVVHAHDLAGESLDLFGSAPARAIRAALKNVDAFVMGSQSLAASYAAARLLPSSAHVAVSAFPLNGERENHESPERHESHASPQSHEEIERVYAEVMSSRSRR
jgi:hypothetical protein